MWFKIYFISIIFSFGYQKPKMVAEKVPHKKFIFHGAEADTTYTVKVTLVLNGKSIATAQKKIKALIEDEENKDEKKGVHLSIINIQSVNGPSVLEAGGVAVLTAGIMGGGGDEDLQLGDENDLDIAMDGDIDMGGGGDM